MDKGKVRDLIDLLEQLEKKVSKFPQTANKYSESIETIQDSLKSLLGQGGIGSTTELNIEFKTLFETIATGAAKGEAGLGRMLGALKRLEMVSGGMSSHTNNPKEGIISLPAGPKGIGQTERISAFGISSGPLNEIKQLTAFSEESQVELAEMAAVAQRAMSQIEADTKKATKAQDDFNNMIEGGVVATEKLASGGGSRTLRDSPDIPDDHISNDEIDEGVISYKAWAESLNLTANQVTSLTGVIDSLEGGTTGLVKVQKNAKTGTVSFKISTEQMGKSVKQTSGDVFRLANSMEFLEGTITKGGRAQTKATGKWQAYGDQILRNVGEVAKWSIAVGVVYGTISRLQELVGQSIENQVKLAEINVVVGDSQRDLNSIFEEALTIANKTGSSVQGVLDSYADAIRVTSNIADESVRFATANQLLEDSLVLSKLGVIDQADAMDLLVASLQQANRELTEGTSLLDKWVATSNNAGVTLNDLATAYSITAGAAADAGVEVGGAEDELSAIIATVAESFPYEGRELGNRVRALIASTSDPSRQQSLFEVGVSPTDVEGQLRPFIEIYQDVADKLGDGLISEDDIGQIAGGNVRQRNILISFIKELNRVQEINGDTADSAGAAQQSLGVQLETVKTAIDRMGNAFTALGQTLGTSGGVLESISSIVDGLTSLVGILEDVIKITGRAGPALALILGGNAALSRAFGDNDLIKGLSSFGTISPNKTARASEQAGLPYTRGDVIKSATLFNKTLGAALPALIAGALQTALGDSETKGADFGAIAGGAIIGAVVSGGQPVGALIGSQIVVGLMDGIRANEEVGNELGEAIAEAFRKSLEEKPPEPDADDPQEANALNTFISGNTTPSSRFFQSLFVDEGSAKKSLGNKGVDEELLGKALEFGTFQAGELTDLDDALKGFDRAEMDAAVDAVNEILKAMFDLAVQTKVDEVAFEALSGTIQAQSSAVANKVRAELREAFSADDIGGGEYFDLLSTLDKIPSQIASLDTTFGEGLVGAIDGVETTEEAFDALFEFIIGTTPEVRNKLQELATIETDDLDAVKKALEEIAFLVNNTKTQPILKPQAPDTIDVTGLSPEQFEAALIQMEVLASNFADALALDMGVENATRIMDGMRDTFIIKSGETFGVLEDASKEFLQTALNDQKQLASGGSGGTSLNIQDIDLPSSSLGKILDTMQYFNSQLSQLGYQSSTSPTVLKFSDDVIQVKDIDSQLLRLALDELIDVSKDQLEGIYNLPTDGSFFVPFTGYDLGTGEDEGLGGALPTFDLAGSDRFESATSQFAAAVDLFASLMTAEELAAVDADNGRIDEKMFKIAELIMSGGVRQAPPKDPRLGTGFEPADGGNLDDSITRIIEAISKAVNKGSSSYGKDFSDSGGSNIDQQYENVLSAIQQVATRDLPPLDLNIQMQAQLQTVLDGRIIAQSVKQFLFADLLRFSGSGGGAQVRYVV